MPRGIYERTAMARANIAVAMTGKIPPNKGRQKSSVIKKVTKFRLGEPIECRIHGLHSNWRLYSTNNVQCRLCAADSQRRSQKKYPLKFLIRWARQRTVNCDITESDLKAILETQGGCCALSGTRFDEQNRPSLDRIDSELGYIQGNIQLVLVEINRMKTDLDQGRFIQLCQKVAETKGKVGHAIEAG